MPRTPAAAGRSWRRKAIEEYLDINEWQVAGIVGAIASFDRGKGIPHQRVKQWVASWEARKERPTPKAA